ncbi:MAG: cation diffusion facilitator family transporter [Jaaginema sp. PMC 1079.18]|nr:cation diffusion facilitator family transporter [Jaaginema sp. PMC 1080.18]MEC4852937.1 cation diffusion facilitator family transporter [Jaaginema sp. PMC 1079.18]MEC4868799.1 cation diffusion facilitator family transporter [Jaaginema sp. PMC 1078.18]
MTDGKNHYQISRLVLWMTLGLLLLLLWAKVSTGLEVHSLSVLSESLHTAIAGFSLLVSWLAVMEIDRPTGREIYGHGKRETVLVLGSAIALSWFWIDLFRSTLEAILNWGTPVTEIRVSLPLIQLLGLLVALTLGLALLNSNQGRKLNYPILRFNGVQLFKDGFLLALATGSLAGVWWGESLFDAIASLMLLILALDSFWQVLNWHFPLLLENRAIAPETIVELIQEIEGVKGCHNVRSRGIVGRLVYISMHLTLEPKIKALTPQIARSIEKTLRDRYGPIQVTLVVES